MPLQSIPRDDKKRHQPTKLSANGWHCVKPQIETMAAIMLQSRSLLSQFSIGSSNICQPCNHSGRWRHCISRGPAIRRSGNAAWLDVMLIQFARPVQSPRPEAQPQSHTDSRTCKDETRHATKRLRGGSLVLGNTEGPPGLSAPQSGAPRLASHRGHQQPHFSIHSMRYLYSS